MPGSRRERSSAVREPSSTAPSSSPARPASRSTSVRRALVERVESGSTLRWSAGNDELAPAGTAALGRGELVAASSPSSASPGSGRRDLAREVAPPRRPRDHGARRPLRLLRGGSWRCSPLLSCASPRRAGAGARGARTTRSSCSAGSTPSPAAKDAVSLGESYWAVRRLLETLSSRGGLLILDDVHWAEPALARPRRLSRRARRRVRSVVLCLTRPELGQSSERRFSSARWDDEHAREILPGPGLDEETRERIVGLAEGNALYVEQLASFAAEGGEGLPRRSKRFSPAASVASRVGAASCFSEPPWSDASSPSALSPLSPTRTLRRSLLALSRAGLRPPRCGCRPRRRRLHLPPRPPPRYRLRER